MEVPDMVDLAGGSSFFNRALKSQTTLQGVTLQGVV